MDDFRSVDGLREFIFTHPDIARSPAFAFHYGPYICNTADLAKEVDALAMDSPYMATFKYAACLIRAASNSSPKACKDLMKNIATDLSVLIPKYPESWYTKVMQEYIMNIVQKFIHDLRAHQIKDGIMESAMANFAPIVPYNAKISRDSEMEIKTNLRAGKVSKGMNRHTFVSTYAKAYESEIGEINILGHLQLANATGILKYSEIQNEFNSILDLFTIMEFNDFDLTGELMAYFGVDYLLNLPQRPTPNEVEEVLKHFDTILSHDKVPMTPDTFTTVVECLSQIHPGSGSEMMSMEAWSALEDGSREYVDKLLEKVNKKDQNIGIFDLDALTAELYTMRHIEINNYSNQFFFGDLGDIEDVIINNYNYIGNDILACEINEKFLAIPYIDIADDYKVKVLAIDRNRKIYHFNNVQEMVTRPENRQPEIKLRNQPLAIPEEVPES